MLTVIKRDGTKDNYNPEKIKSVLTAAGLETDDIKKLISNIDNWITNQNKEMTTLEIRDQVITQLETLNPYVAGLFKWYQKTKDPSITV